MLAAIIFWAATHNQYTYDHTDYLWKDFTYNSAQVEKLDLEVLKTPSMRVMITLPKETSPVK